MPPKRPPRPKTRDDFEIAIICALTLEADAVIALFDHHWDEDDQPSFGKTRGDPNAYSTGVMGRHNVVLAHLPGMGKVAAGNIAAFCRMSFPNINLALVAGICGGAPLYDKGQILLGDVIISTGVVQYDFGRQFPDKFEMKDTLSESLGRPNLEIRNLLAKLTTARQIDRLQTACGSYLDLLCHDTRRPVNYPGRANDNLFPADYRHKHQNSPVCITCASCHGDADPVCHEAIKAGCDALGCDLKQRLPRHAEAVDKPCPTVHFGTFASGDTVMKSGRDRDQLTLKNKVIGFEMESVGVWEVFPCVVIKSVCDYADSHKNKDWQSYAAASAAACTKAFLEYWDSAAQDLQAEAEAKKLQERLLESLRFPEMNERRNTIASETPSTFKWIFDESSEDSEDFDDSDDSDDYDDSRQHPYRPHGETSDKDSSDDDDDEEDSVPWRRERDWDSFEQWLASDQKIYWISGKPGSGKRTLMKFLLSNPKTLESLGRWREGTVILSHFFWKPGSAMQQSYKGFLCSIVCQLLAKDTNFFDLFRDMIGTTHRASPSDWDQRELCKVLYEYRQQSSQPVCVFIDALDEAAPGQDTLDLLQFVKALVSKNIKICVSSRPERLFQLQFEGHPHLRMHELTATDIEEYSETALRTSTMLKPKGINIRDLARQVATMADGIFLWAVLVTQSLIRGIYNGDSEDEIDERLNSSPKGLMNLYRDIMLRTSEDRPFYQRFMSMAINLSFVKSPYHNDLTVFDYMMVMDVELLDRYVVQGGQASEQELQTKTKVTKNLLEVACAGFLEVRGYESVMTGNVFYTHRSAQEFLLDTTEGLSLWKPCDISQEELLTRHFKIVLAKERHHYTTYDDRSSSRLDRVLRNVAIWHKDLELPLDLVVSFLHLTQASHEHAFLKNAKDSLDFWAKPKCAKGQFLLLAAHWGHFQFAISNLNSLGESNAHETMYCIFCDICRDFGYKNEPLSFSNLEAFQLILNSGYSPNWNIVTSRSKQHIGSPWFIFLVGTLMAHLISKFYGDEQTLTPLILEYIHMFRKAGASMASTVPILFRFTPDAYIPVALMIAEVFTAGSPVRLEGRGSILFVEMNASALVSLVTSWVYRALDPAIYLGPAQTKPFMKALAFGTAVSRELFVVESDSVSALITEPVKAALFSIATAQLDGKAVMRWASEKCDHVIRELAPQCRSTKDAYIWKGFELWRAP